MRGHQPLVKARQQGRKPAESVQVELQAWPASPRCGLDREIADWFRSGRVFVEPKDAIDLLDLRFLVGCDVDVHGSDADRVRRLYAALVRHKARRVIAHCGRVVDGEGRLDFILDSQEVLTWHA